MATPDLPEISALTSEQLLALRDAIDARISKLRAELVEKAAALGMAIADGNAKKRKRRASAQKEQE